MAAVGTRKGEPISPGQAKKIVKTVSEQSSLKVQAYKTTKG